jgi:transposase
VTINMIGRDTAKLVFQVHAVDAAGNVVIRRKIQRNDLITFREA